MTGLALINATIHTCDPARRSASVVVIEDGLITHVGDARLVGRPARAARLRSRRPTRRPRIRRLPHPPGMVSQSYWHVRLPWTTDVDEILRFIREYAEAHPPEEVPFLYFEYYPSAIFRDGAPTKELLDTAVSDRPCLCQDFSEHEHWVNSKMLELMEITRETPDPVPGLEMFVRDENGEPTGLLREIVHLHFLDRLYEKIGWTPPQELTPERVGDVLPVHDRARGDGRVRGPGRRRRDRRRRSPSSTGAVSSTCTTKARCAFVAPEDLPDAIRAAASATRRSTASAHVGMNTLKLFLDGTNESGNSAVLAPMCSHASGDATRRDRHGRRRAHRLLPSCATARASTSTSTWSVTAPSGSPATRWRQVQRATPRRAATPGRSR